jgi:hypothetical protein
MFYARTLMHATAFLSTAHTSLRVFRFGASPSSSSATWRTAKSQSRCLSCGSLLTKQLRRSATRHRPLVAGPSAGNGNHVPRHLSACHHQVGRASFGAQRRETALPRSTSIRQNLWKSNQGSGHTKAKHQQAQPGSRGLSALSYAHLPNWSVKRTPILASKYWYPACFALRCRLPWALGPV